MSWLYDLNRVIFVLLWQVTCGIIVDVQAQQLVYAATVLLYASLLLNWSWSRFALDIQIYQQVHYITTTIGCLLLLYVLFFLKLILQISHTFKYMNLTCWRSHELFQTATCILFFLFLFLSTVPRMLFLFRTFVFLIIILLLLALRIIHL